jgi:hypothetical protein
MMVIMVLKYNQSSLYFVRWVAQSGYGLEDQVIEVRSTAEAKGFFL